MHNVKLLRALLILWLSLSVPTMAMASVVNGDHCKRTGMAGMSHEAHGKHAMHAEMMMQGEHASHMAHAGDVVKTDKTHCSCGCNCSGSHCVTSCAGLLAVSGLRDFLNGGRDSRLPTSGSARALAAHHLDLLRPPSLS